jgi:GTPase SAR1 family protein
MITGLVGNKTDLPEGEKQVDQEKGAKIYNDCQLGFYVEVSAKTGFGVEDLFDEVAAQLIV